MGSGGRVKEGDRPQDRDRRLALRLVDRNLTGNLLLAAVAWFLALWLQDDLHLNGLTWQQTAALLLLLPLQGGTLLGFGVRSAKSLLTVSDLVPLFKATTSVALVMAVLAPHLAIPPVAPILYGLLAPILLLAPSLFHPAGMLASRPVRALVVGAGRAGRALVAQLLSSPNPPYLPVVLVDDDPEKWGRKVEGVPIAGSADQIPRLVHAYRVDAILIAIPSATAHQMRRLVALCEESGLPFLTLPPRCHEVQGPRGVASLRRVTIEDLLDRSQPRLDWSLISKRLAGKRVLVTGGGGSIGSELCRQLADLPIARLIVLDHSEFNLYRLERRLREATPHLEAVLKLGSCADEATVHHLLEQYRPEVVFHAAAYKQLPLLESQVREAVVNNLLGTYRLAKASVRHGVSRFVLISTDKAVNPTCVMGATKRAAEIVCQGFDRLGKTRFITVRFGNVLGSAGSVVPLFREQIERGGPVTVTHPEVSRYFMTKEEACQLILEATAVGRGGEIFVLDMGEPIKIRELAEQMIRLSGKVPYRDIEIRYIGLRPGEKLHEELFHPQEPLLSTPYEKLLLARSRPCDPQFIERLIEKLTVACRHYNEIEILKLLRCLVPEFTVSEGDHGDHRAPRLHRSE